MIGGADGAIQFYQWSGDIMSQVFTYGFAIATVIGIIWFIGKSKRKTSQR